MTKQNSTRVNQENPAHTRARTTLRTPAAIVLIGALWANTAFCGLSAPETSAHAPSADCSKAGTEIEKTICQTETLARLDRQLAEAYAAVRRTAGADIKQQQRSWLKERNACAEAGSSTISACLEDAYRQRLAELDQHDDDGIRIKQDISQLTQAEWLSILSANDQCANSTDERNKRFVRRLKLTNRESLLFIACDFGAYQDSQLVYKLDKQDNDVIARKLNWYQPTHANGWQLRKHRKLTGHAALSDDKTMLEVYSRSAGSGLCGHTARYEISAIDHNTAVKPVAAKGHDDCLNGKPADQWPELSFD